MIEARSLTPDHKDFDVTPAVLAHIPSQVYQNDQQLQKALPFPYFLMMPLATSPFIKISGVGGDVNPQWRQHEEQDLQRITRTLDAFAHFVLHASAGSILIGDLQGNTLQAFIQCFC